VGDSIAIDIGQFREQAARLQESISAFEPYIGYFSQNRDTLEGNSDFLEAYRGLIDNMSDDASPELLTTM
jgi:hypothetical protein